jgi:hypothetical protein
MVITLRSLLILSCHQFDLGNITNALADMEGEEEVPKIKLGDASCAAPFTSKLSNVSASEIAARSYFS